MQKLGYERNVMTSVWQGKGDRSGIPADVQASQHDSTAHAQRFFLPKVQKQMTVMSFDDITDVLLTYIGGRNKWKCARDQGGSWVQFSSVYFC